MIFCWNRLMDTLDSSIIAFCFFAAAMYFLVLLVVLFFLPTTCNKDLSSLNRSCLCILVPFTMGECLLHCCVMHLDANKKLVVRVVYFSVLPTGKVTNDVVNILLGEL